MRKIQIVVACVAVMFTAGQVQAGPITFSFSGTVYDVDFDNGPPTEFVNNDTFSGTYTFDSTTADSNGDSASGSYTNSISLMSIAVGSYSASFSNGHISIWDNHSAFKDHYTVYSSSPSAGSSVLGLSLRSISLQLQDANETAFSNDFLPLTPPVLTDFTWQSLRLSFQKNEAAGPVHGYVRASIDSITLEPQPEITTTPEPTSLAIFGIGALCMGAGAARRRRKEKASV